MGTRRCQVKSRWEPRATSSQCPTSPGAQARPGGQGSLYPWWLGRQHCWGQTLVPNPGTGGEGGAVKLVTLWPLRIPGLVEAREWKQTIEVQLGKGGRDPTLS